jgi:hypothetical protein
MESRRRLAIGFFLIAAFGSAASALGQESSVSPSVAAPSSTATLAPSISLGDPATNITGGGISGSTGTAGDPTGASLSGSGLSPNLSIIGTAGNLTGSGQTGGQGAQGLHSASSKLSSNSFGPSSAFGVSSAGWGSTPQLTSGFQPAPASPQAGFGSIGMASAQPQNPSMTSLAKAAGALANSAPTGDGKHGTHSSLSSISQGMAKGTAGGAQTPATQPASIISRTTQGQPGQTGEGQSGQVRGEGGGADGASYSAAFPDSTKSTAVLSPPDMADQTVRTVSPSMNFGFPDLTERQFLEPSFRGTGQSSGEGEQDTFKRIERRLQAYSDAARKRGMEREAGELRHGVEAEHGFGGHMRPSQGTLARRTTGLTPGGLGPVLP